MIFFWGGMAARTFFFFFSPPPPGPRLVMVHFVVGSGSGHIVVSENENLILALDYPQSGT